MEIDQRILKNNRAVRLLSKMLKAGNVSKAIKIHIYEIVTCPVVLYACKTWATEIAKINWKFRNEKSQGRYLEELEISMDSGKGGQIRK